MKPVLIILHGWAYDTGKWQKFTDGCTGIGFDVTMPRIPGLTEATDKSWTVDSYTDWLDGIIRQHKRKVILLGHSNGGRIALWYTLRHPEFISHLVLIDSAGIRHDGLPDKIRRIVFKSVARIGKKFIRSSALKKLLYRFAGASDYPEAPAHMQKTMSELLESDRALDPSLVRTPTTIIWGGLDRITPVSDGRTLHQSISGSVLRVIPDARHAPQFSHPEVVLKVLLERIRP